MLTKKERRGRLRSVPAERGKGYKLFHGNIYTLADYFPSGLVHTMITSIPYWDLREYGEQTKVKWPDGWEGQYGMEPDPELFVHHTVLIFRKLYRVLRNDGTLWLDMGDTSAKRNRPGDGRIRYKDKDLLFMPHEIAIALRNDGWFARSEIVWNKTNPTPEPVNDRPTRSHQFLFLFSKRPYYYYDREAIREKTGQESSWDDYVQGYGTNKGADADRYGKGYRKKSSGKTHPNGRNRRDVWTMATGRSPGYHFAAFPEDYVRMPILAGTSAHGCCIKCRAPWKRVMSKPLGGHTGGSWQTEKRAKTGNRPGGGQAIFDTYIPGQTIGWKPTCDCGEKRVCKPIVMDPFSGSATTGVVALRHGREYLGVELNPEYFENSGERLWRVAEGVRSRL